MAQIAQMTKLNTIYLYTNTVCTDTLTLRANAPVHKCVRNKCSVNRRTVYLPNEHPSQEPVPIHKGLFFYYPDHITPLALSGATNDVV